MKNLLLVLGLFVFAGCSTPKTISEVSSLENINWMLIMFDGKPYEPKLTQSRLASLTLQSEGNRIVGFGNCNSFSGSYTLEGNKIHFTLVSTKMFCNEMMEVEDYLFKTLTQVEYNIEGDLLTLKNKEGKSVTFRKAKL
jgi:heat shock protein HslJ